MTIKVLGVDGLKTEIAPLDVDRHEYWPDDNKPVGVYGSSEDWIEIGVKDNYFVYRRLSDDGRPADFRPIWMDSNACHSGVLLEGVIRYRNGDLGFGPRDFRERLSGNEWWAIQNGSE